MIEQLEFSKLQLAQTLVCNELIREQAWKGGERAGTRTRNLVIKSHLLYQLSYAPQEDADQ